MDPATEDGDYSERCIDGDLSIKTVRKIPEGGVFAPSARCTEIHPMAFACLEEHFKCRFAHPVTLWRFSFCSSNIIEIDIRNSEIKGLQEGIFQRCFFLNSIILPKFLEDIGNFCFQYAFGLRSIDFPKSLVRIGEGAFSQSSLERLNLSVCERVVIEEKAFSDCSSLYNVFTGKAQVIFGKRVFSGCDMLKLVISSKGVYNAYYESCFENCKELDEVSAGMSYGSNVFFNCGKLRRHNFGMAAIMNDNIWTGPARGPAVMSFRKGANVNKDAFANLKADFVLSDIDKDMFVKTLNVLPLNASWTYKNRKRVAPYVNKFVVNLVASLTKARKHCVSNKSYLICKFLPYIPDEIIFLVLSFIPIKDMLDYMLVSS